jgi:ferric-dicitrate binding protein FerR (iron transport regulator)
MDGSNRFAHLLKKYMSKETSDAEYIELMQLIRTGAYDEELKEVIGTTWFGGGESPELPAGRSEEMISKILTAEDHATRLIPLRAGRWRYWAAAAVLMAVMAGGWWLWRGRGEARLVADALQKSQSKMAPEPGRQATPEPRGQVTQEPTGRQFIHLPDGSTVLLNEGSRLNYPDNFSNSKREVELIGEAYFDIREEKGRPFIVRAGKTTTTVLGTSFNIMAYPGGKAVTVTVITGKVRVGDDKERSHILTPNQQILVTERTEPVVQDRVNVENVMAWKERYMVFDNISLEEAATIISNKYGVNVVLTDDGLKQYKISATFLDKRSLEQVLQVVCGVVNGYYSFREDGSVAISKK